MDALRRDLAFAVRRMVRERGFTAVAVFTLALGIGANAAFFSILNAVLLRPLPYPEQDRLVSIAGDGLTAGNLEEWRAGVPALDKLAAYTIESGVVTHAGPAQVARALLVSPDFFELLGSRAVEGRLPGADDPVAGTGAVVSAGLWAALGGDEATGDRIVTFKDVTYPVVGVLPAGFTFLRYRDVDLWLPLSQADRRVGALGRLTRGATISRALEQAEAVSRRLTPDVVERDRLVRITRIGDILNGEVRAPLYIVFGAGMFVLLIACVNVTNLLMSKATARTAELAVRASLGASRLDLVRQLLTENALLSLVGATAGLMVASWTTDLLVRLAPWTPRLDQSSIDVTVLCFTLGIAVLCTLVAGLGPALQSTRPALAVRTPRGSSETRSAARVRGFLVAGEIALALVVVIGSGLLIRTFLVLRPVSPGFETADRIVARMTFPSDDRTAVNAFVDDLLRRIQTEPGSPRGAATTDLPLSGESALLPVAALDGRSLDNGERPQLVHFRAATPNYMDVIGMPVMRGRGLSVDDRPGSTPVVVVNESAANRLWPGEEPVGRSIAFDPGGGPATYTVVGVSADASIFGGNTGSRPEAFVSLSQTAADRLRLVVHAPDRGITAERIRQIAASVDPLIPLDDFESFDEMVAYSVALPRFQMVLMTAFGGLAFVLAIVGCYGVLATAVSRRRREIGVRVALGATRVDVISHVLRGGIAYILGGLATGIFGAWATTRLLAGVLYGVEPTDPVTFTAATLALLATTLIAALLPARRAASVQPAEILRAD